MIDVVDIREHFLINIRALIACSIWKHLLLYVWLYLVDRHIKWPVFCISLWQIIQTSLIVCPLKLVKLTELLNLLHLDKLYQFYLIMMKLNLIPLN